MNDQGIFNDNFLDMMSIISFVISLYNLELNEKQLSNDDVAREVQVNRDKLEEQNDIYLKTIIEQNNRIIGMLERK